MHQIFKKPKELDKLKGIYGKYRTHYCSEIGTACIGSAVELSGWVSRKRSHGGLLFIDLRDYTGVTQCIVEDRQDDLFKICEDLSYESVIKVYGLVAKRPKGKENLDLNSGSVEVKIVKIEELSSADELPFAIHQENPIAEELRLKYRFLDFRRTQMADRIKLRADVIKEMRFVMEEMGFMEIQTPLLTSSSPEGARDFVVPSRLHKGQFYALPQSPQIFKQLLMSGGFEKYYQVAFVFRDEDSRADRAVGGFNQLDLEIAFAEQEDVLNSVEVLIKHIFNKFSKTCALPKKDFPRISFQEAMQSYGSDKPDLRNPLKFIDFSNILRPLAAESSQLQKFFGAALETGHIGIMPMPKLSSQSRKFFDTLREEAIKKGSADMGYIVFSDNGSAKGSLAKIFDNTIQEQIRGLIAPDNDGAIMIAHPNKKQFYQIISALRCMAGTMLDIIEQHMYRFLWVVDFPMYEQKDDDSWDFSHNPFSMPQDLSKLNMENIEDIVGYQYDLVCNGYELASGAVRNHKPEIMYKVFELAGFDKEYVDKHFFCMINAFKYGTPPHAGCAPGIDRIVMLLAPECTNVRDVIPFPLTRSGLDLLCGAPSELPEERLKELGIRITKSPKDNSVTEIAKKAVEYVSTEEFHNQK